jgi:hypothetical protein
MRCPFCSEKILATARKCKHCGEFLDMPLHEDRTAEADLADRVAVRGRDSLILAVLGWILGIGLGAILPGIYAVLGGLTFVVLEGAAVVYGLSALSARANSSVPMSGMGLAGVLIGIASFLLMFAAIFVALGSPDRFRF